MADDEERIQRLSAEYEALRKRQQQLLDELKQVQQHMGDLMLKIIDVTRA